jgi:hypothetical protein
MGTTKGLVRKAIHKLSHENAGRHPVTNESRPENDQHMMIRRCIIIPQTAPNEVISMAVHPWINNASISRSQSSQKADLRTRKIATNENHVGWRKRRPLPTLSIVLAPASTTLLPAFFILSMKLIFSVVITMGEFVNLRLWVQRLLSIKFEWNDAILLFLRLCLPRLRNKEKALHEAKNFTITSVWRLRLNNGRRHTRLENARGTSFHSNGSLSPVSSLACVRHQQTIHTPRISANYNTFRTDHPSRLKSYPTYLPFCK